MVSQITLQKSKVVTSKVAAPFNSSRMSTPSLRPPKPLSQHEEVKNERRSTKRMPIVLPANLQVFGKKKSIVVSVSGKTINMSSGGLLLGLYDDADGVEVDSACEVNVQWPAQLDGCIPLKLEVLGRVVRTSGKQVGIVIEKYEFKTRGIGVL